LIAHVPSNFNHDIKIRMTSPREEFRAGAFILLPAVVGGVPFGLITGVAGTTAGLTPFETIASSVLIFSGIAQLIIYQLIGNESPTPVILLAVLVASLRLMMYSAALAPHLGHLQMRWKLLLSYFTTDQGFAASVAHFPKAGGAEHGAWFHLGGGLVQWVPWQICVAIGAVLGAQVPPSWSLDFAVPLLFLAMLIPAIKDRGTGIAATIAGIVALLAAGFPFRLSLIVAAVVGIGAGFLSDRWCKPQRSFQSK
jgi:predicted branched-subunit amino acid permease